MIEGKILMNGFSKIFTSKPFTKFVYSLKIKYQLQEEFKTEEEWKLYKEVTRQHLPVTFRINPTYPNYEQYAKILKDPKFLDERFFSSKGKHF